MSRKHPIPQSREQPLPLVASHSPRGTHAALPRPLTSFIGRQRDVAVARALLARDDVRLVTVTGPGGVGKTRLAMQVASAMEDAFPDGVWFIALAQVRDPALVLPTIAAELGVPEAGDQPQALGMLEHLRLREMLLILDNFEQVAHGAPALVDVLAAASGVKALVTSRERLRISGEHTLTLAPLELPIAVNRDGQQTGLSIAPDAALASPAVQLFVERARAVRTDFVLDADNASHAVQICTRLDGLPLALELAAARLAHLATSELAARLDRRLPLLTDGPRDLPDRLRTMHGAIAWSYDLLTPGEQAFFRRVAVFSGGCSIEAAQAIVNLEDDPNFDVFAGIASLVSKHLLGLVPGRAGQSRYEMLETVREFALERLSASGETQVHQRHADWYLRLAEQAWETIWVSPMQVSQLDQLSDEHDNWWAALTWLETADDPVNWLRLIGALCPFWLFRSHRTAGKRWLDRGLAAAEHAAVSPEVLARSLHGAAVLREGEPESQPYLEASLALWRQLENQWGIGASLVELGLTFSNQGHYARAARMSNEALEALGPGHDVWAGLAHLVRGRAAIGQGNLRVATSSLETGLRLTREANASESVGLMLYHLALVAIKQGNTQRAAPLLAESLDIWRVVVRLEGLAHSLAGVALFAAATGQVAAPRLWGAVAALKQITGYQFWHPERDELARAEAELRSELGATRFDQEFAAGKALGWEEALAEAAAVLDSAVVGVPIPTKAEAHFGLTPRELEVLRLVVAGQTDRQIGEALFISRRTAEGHVARILAKLDVRSRSAAVATAISAGLVVPELRPSA